MRALVDAIRSLWDTLLPATRGDGVVDAAAAAKRREAAPLAPRLAAAPVGGRHAIGLAEIELYDKRRRKMLPLRITYPKELEYAFPVIAFSHGAGGSHADYALLIQHWAAHGYVCLQPSHADATLPGEASSKDRFRHWASRPTDLTFLFDSIDMVETVVPELRGRLDTSRIGASGHSFGAGTAQLLAGARLRRIPGGQRFADKRVRAVVLLAPQGSGQLHGANAWAQVRIPMMTITGSRDRGWGGGPEWREEPFHRAPAGNKYLIVIEGGRHDFGGIIRSATSFPYARDEREAGITQQASLSFWDAHLKGSTDAEQFLKRRGLETMLGDDARLERK
jgi:predicted dienelactone hydrolase